MSKNYELIEINRVNMIFSSVVGLIIFETIVQLNPGISFSRTLVVILISSYFGISIKWIIGEKVGKWVLEKPLKPNKPLEWYAKV